MADKYFVDTDILICARDTSAGIKYGRARPLVQDLWTSGQGVLSTPQELALGLRAIASICFEERIENAAFFALAKFADQA
jgi:hypothetical protein